MRSVLVVMLLGSAAWADDGDDAISTAASKVSAAWSPLSNMSSIHNYREALYQGIIGLQRVCDLYATEYNDRRDFISRNTRAEDDASSLGMGALRTLGTYATAGQQTALTNLNTSVSESLRKQKQAVQDARAAFLKDWAAQAGLVKAAITQGDLPQRLRDALGSTGYGDVAKLMRTSMDNWFDADLSYLQSPQKKKMTDSVDAQTTNYKSMLDAEKSSFEQDLQVASGRDELLRCWPGE